MPNQKEIKELSDTQQMRIEINHRPVHQNFRKRKILDQNK